MSSSPLRSSYDIIACSPAAESLKLLGWYTSAQIDSATPHRHAAWVNAGAAAKHRNEPNQPTRLPLVNTTAT